MFDRFTASGHEAMKLAHDEAATLGHDYLGTEHLLLGVLRTRRGGGLLGRSGLSLDGARERVVAIVGAGATPADADGTGAPSTSRTMDVLVLAWQEARTEDEIGPEHILLALLREGQGWRHTCSWERASTSKRCATSYAAADRTALPARGLCMSHRRRCGGAWVGSLASPQEERRGVAARDSLVAIAVANVGPHPRDAEVLTKPLPSFKAVMAAA